MLKPCTTLLLALAICISHAMAQGRRIATFPYSQPFTWITAATASFPAADVDGGEFTLDAGTTGWTAAIGSHGLNNNGGAGGALRIQTTAGVNNGTAGFVWHGDLTGYCADSLTIAWSKVANGTGTRVNELRIGTNAGGGSAFTDLPLASVAGGAWPLVDNSAAAQSGMLRVKLPASLTGAADARIRIYAINTGGTGSQPRVVVDNLSITAAGAPAAGGIDSIGAAADDALTLHLNSGVDADSIILIRRAGAPPITIPADGTRYTTSQALSETETVVFAGPAGARTIRDSGLQSNTLYHFALFTLRSCNGRYSARGATATARTTGSCAGPPATIAAPRTVARNQTSALLGYVSGARVDSVVIIRRRGERPIAAPADGVRYKAGQGLNGTDTVVYAGPTVAPLLLGGLRPDATYIFALYGLQSCNGAYSTSPALDTVITTSPPAIVSEPAGGAACPGGRFTFAVLASGPNLRYQWRKNGADIPGANGATHAIDPVTPATAGVYDVRVMSDDDPLGGPGSPATSAVLQSGPALLKLNAPPAIVTGPAEQRVCRGGGATFAVTATGSGLAYQWRRDGVPIPGATGATYTIAAAAITDTGYYDVVITGACEPQQKGGARLLVGVEPGIVAAPESRTVCPGERATLRVVASGTDLRYQWRRNGRAIAGATGDAYTIDGMRDDDAGVYDVVVSGACPPEAIAPAATITIGAAPIITAQPADQSVFPGADVTFRVTASGSGPLRYQWRRDGVDIPGATAATYTLNSASVEDIAEYSCVVANLCTPPVMVTNSAWLFVRGSAGIVTPPGGGTICAGERITLRTTATGAGLAFIWRKDGKEIAGATRPHLVIENASAADAGSYTCTVIPVEGKALTTPAALLLVATAPRITGQPEDVEACRGERATFEVIASGTGLRYQWRRDGRPLAGALSGIYSIPAAGDADTGMYDCIIAGTCGEPLASMGARLRIAPGPAITHQPETQVVKAGGEAGFQVAASGTGLTYEWRKNGRTIPGADAPRYSIPHVSTEHAGIYDVLVGGCSGLVLSEGALLRVERVPGEVEGLDGSPDAVAAAMLSVTPNPLDGVGRLDIRLPDGARMDTPPGAHLRLYDVMGRLVLDLPGLDVGGGVCAIPIDGTALPSGRYHCRLETAAWRGRVGTLIVVH